MSGAVIAASVVQARRRIERDLEGAVGPSRAIAYVPPRRPVARRIFRQLVGYGAVVEATPGRYYIDPQGMDRYRSSRRKRAAALILLALAGVGAVVTLGAAVSLG